MGQSTSVDADTLPDEIDHDLFKLISGGLYDQAKFDAAKDENGNVTRDWVMVQAKKLSPIEKMMLPPIPKGSIPKQTKQENLFDKMDVDFEKEQLLEKAQATSVGFMSFKKGLSRHAYSHADEYKPRGPKVNLNSQTLNSLLFPLHSSLVLFLSSSLSHHSSLFYLNLLSFPFFTFKSS
jgi:hypothetical protein